MAGPKSCCLLLLVCLQPIHKATSQSAPQDSLPRDGPTVSDDAVRPVSGYRTLQLPGYPIPVVYDLPAEYLQHVDDKARTIGQSQPTDDKDQDYIDYEVAQQISGNLKKVYRPKVASDSEEIRAQLQEGPSPLIAQNKFQICSPGGVVTKNEGSLNEELPRTHHSTYTKRKKYPCLGNHPDSEELLDQILGASRPASKEGGIESAFIRKTTTYNVTKRLDDKHRKSYLLEKKVDFSTNLNYLDSNERTTNFSDSHSSVFQTVLDHERDEGHGSHYYIPVRVHLKNFTVNDTDRTFQKPYEEDHSKVVNKWEHIKSKPNEETNIKHPSQFVGGQDTRNFQNSSSEEKPSGKDDDNVQISESRSVQKINHEFVGGQYVEIPDKEDRYNEDALDSHDGEITPQHFSGKMPSKDVGNNNDEVMGGSNSIFDNGQNIPVQEESGNEIVGQVKLGNEHEEPGEFVGGQYIARVKSYRNKEQVTNINPETTTSLAVELPSLSPSKTAGNKNETIISDESDTSEEDGDSEDLVESPDTEVTQKVYPDFQNRTTGKPATNDISKGKPYSHTEVHTESEFQIGDNKQIISTVTPREQKRKETNKKIKKINISNVQPVLEGKLHAGKSSKPTTETANVENSIHREELTGRNITDVKITKAKDLPTSTTSFPESTRSTLDNQRIFTIIPSTDEKVVFKAIDDDVGVVVSVSTSPDFNTKQKPPKPTNSVYELKSTTPKEESDNQGNNDDSDDSLKDSTTTARSKEHEKGDTQHSESVEYVDENDPILGIPNQNGVFQKDPNTGWFVTEVVFDGLPSSTTETNKSKDETNEDDERPGDRNGSEVVGTSEAEEDDMVGQYSDIQPNRLRSQDNSSILMSEDNESQVDSVSTTQDPETTSESTTTILQEDTTTSEVVDDVELYAGKDDEPVEVQYNTSIKHKPNIAPSDLQGLTELCLPLHDKNNVSIYDLLSGKLYIESNGIKIPLYLRENPMKNCTSGTVKCSLALDFKPYQSSLRSTLSPDSSIFAVDKESLIPKTNEKRHIVKEDMQRIQSQERSDVSTEEADEEPSTKRMHAAVNPTSKKDTPNVFHPSFQDALTKELLKYDRVITQKEKAQHDDSVDNIKLVEYKETPKTGSFLIIAQPVRSSSFHSARNSKSFPKSLKDSEEKGTSLEEIEDDENTAPHNLDSDTRNLKRFDLKKEHDKKLVHLHRSRPARGTLHSRGAVAKTPGSDEGTCGCSSPVVGSSRSATTPNFKHFVNKRTDILASIVTAVKDWVVDTQVK